MKFLYYVKFLGKGNGNENHLVAIFFIILAFLSDISYYLYGTQRSSFILSYEINGILYFERQNTGIAAACFATANFFEIFI